MNFADSVMKRGLRAARTAETRARMALAEFARQSLGIDAQPAEDGVLLSGKALLRRAGNDARLRWLAHYWRDTQ